MRVAYLELQDIKSYAGTTRIDLTEGVNAICGANGSGKTTILEAIGLALFDFAPYSQAAFVREGQKTGTIRVGLEGRDERLYEVVRRIGTGATHYVADAETGDRIAERGEAVRDWIRREALDIDAGTNLESLFKNAVGVPQGLMTADFQTTASARKAVFDPLLRVEEYRQAYEELRNTVNVLRDRTAAVDNEIAGLRTDADRIPAKAEEIERLRERVQAASEEILRSESYLAEQEAARSALDEVARQLVDLTGAVRDARYNASRFSDLVASKSAEVEKARVAIRVVEDNETGYHLFNETGDRLQELQRLNQKRHELENRLTGEQATRDSIFAQIEQLDGELRAAGEAGERAEALRPRVTQQEQLEREGNALDQLLIDLKRWRQDEAQARRDCGKLDQARRAREAEMSAARTAAEQAGELEPAQASLATLADRLARLGPLKARLKALKEDGVGIKNERIALLERLDRREALSARLAESTPLAVQLDTLVSRERDLREARASTRAAIEYQDLARSELSRAHCPLLDVECPVVSQDPETLTRFDRRADSLAGELETLEVELGAVEPQLAAARTAAAAVQKLQVEVARLDAIDAALTQTEERLRRCIAEVDEVNASIEGEDEWRREQSALQSRIRDLQAATTLAATAPLLERQLAEDERALAARQENLAELEKRVAELSEAEERARELKEELAGLGNPRQEQQRLAGIAARKPEIERLILAAQTKMADAAARVKALLAALEEYSTLAAEMEDARRIQAVNAEAHELYIRHQAEAAELPDREAALATLQQSLEAAQAALASAESTLAEAEAGYDAEEHGRLRESCAAASTLLIQQRERLDAIKTDLSRLEEEMAMLQRAAAKLRTRETEKEGLVRTAHIIAFIRDTIRSAGPAITETILLHISAGANDIYAEIIDDHAAELRWDREYEVLVQRGAESRKFAQLSGGEQMSAALAVRLALLKEMSEVDFAFFDEPTQNMDSDRRANLAGQIQHLRGFDQLIVISHDDTFEHHTDNLIRLRKEQEATRVDFGGVED